MILKPLSMRCPHCGSTEVIYSCTPSCCFNHVCSKCYTTFEPLTTKVGEFTGELGSLPPDPDPSGATAACARCGEIKLFMIADDEAVGGRVLCVACKALLTLELSEVAPG